MCIWIFFELSILVAMCTNFRVCYCVLFYTKAHTHASTVSVNIGLYLSISLQTLFFSINLTLVRLHVNIIRERNLNWKQNHWYSIIIINQDFLIFWKHRGTFIPQINRKWYFKMDSTHWISKQTVFYLCGTYIYKFICI